MGSRLFVSVDLEGLAEGIRRAQEPLTEASGLRTTDPEQAHLTLKFLGETDPGRVPTLVEELEAAVAESGVGPFTAAFGGLGVFPEIEYIRVVWLGVREGGGQFRALHEAIEERTVGLGFDPEDHEFTPHVTLARMDHAGDKELVQRVVRERDPDIGRMRVDSIRLTESTLADGGPEYTTVADLPL